MKVTDKISQNLQDWCDRGSYDVVLPNFFIGEYEMDIFKLTSSGYIIEYEIKVSRGDYFTDFKKGGEARTLFGEEEGGRELGRKHCDMIAGKLDCNKFFYVVPEGMISIDEVPSHCGLIYYHEHQPSFRTFTVIRNAKMLHRNKKLDNNEFLFYLLKKLSFRDSINKGNIYNLKMQNKRLKRQLGEM